MADNVRAIDTLGAEHIADMLSLLKWVCKYRSGIAHRIIFNNWRVAFEC